jgi:hypothetical protein
VRWRRALKIQPIENHSVYRSLMLTRTLLLVSLAALPAMAQPPQPQPGASEPFTIVERTAHSRTWHRTEWEQTFSGALIPHEHKITELATGMHYQSPQDGTWLESKEVIEGFPGGAVARQGPHSVIWANNLATPGSIDLQMANGTRLISQVIGLCYFDSATGTNVLIAEIKDCQGAIVQSLAAAPSITAPIPLPGPTVWP